MPIYSPASLATNRRRLWIGFWVVVQKGIYRANVTNLRSLGETGFWSADPRELFSRKHVYDTGSSDAGLHGDKSRVIVSHFTYDCGLGAERMSPHTAKHGGGSFFRNDR